MSECDYFQGVYLSNCRELLLIDACQTYGLGNWADIADHIGSYRTKEEVQEHYHKVFLESPNFPLPVRFHSAKVKWQKAVLTDRLPQQIARDLTTSQQKFQSIKKARLEAAQARPLRKPSCKCINVSSHLPFFSAMPPPKPAASVPLCHEVGGFMPARLEFEQWVMCFGCFIEVLLKFSTANSKMTRKL